MSRKLLRRLSLFALSITGLILAPLQPSVALQPLGSAPERRVDSEPPGGRWRAFDSGPRLAADQIGHIAGTVTHAVTSAPVAGVRIEATASPTQTAQANSDAGGAYALDLTAGTYTLTATAYGYAAWTAPNSIAVIAGITTTQDIGLTPLQTHVISGYVRDAMGGWPLYAQLSVSASGLAGPAGWSDPVTGYYSLTVVANVTHTLTAQAWATGYQINTVSVPPLASNTTLNLDLEANSDSCVAPGYGRIGFIEDFDQLAPPVLGNWATLLIANAGGAVPEWATRAGTRYPGGQAAHSAPNLAFFNSFSAYSGGAARLFQTSGLNMTALPTTALSFWMYHDPGYAGSNDRVQVQVSTDNGLNWQNVDAPIARYRPFAAWLEHTVSLNAYASATNLRLGFLAISEYGNDIHLDDITIAICQVQAGGLVVGNVYDANTQAGLNDAVITGPGGGVTSGATSDPKVDDGFYAIFSPAGSQVFNANRAGGYGNNVHVVAVQANNTVKQNFDLPAGQLQVNALPSAVAVTLTLNTMTTTQIALHNVGTLGANYNLVGMYAPAYTPMQSAHRPGRPARSLPSEDLNPVAPSSPADKPATLDAPELPAAGAVIASWPINGVPDSWGIGVNAYADDLWIAEFKSGGSNFDYRFLRDGTNTGNKINAYFGGAYALDMAYNPHTGMLWQVNYGGDRCIHELDPAALAQTGSKLCPPFGTSQMALAYDPNNDTFFTGSWNDRVINHFTADGVLLDSRDVGLNIAGLAYNPGTGHLFTTCYSCPYDIYLLDASNNYAVLGAFNVSGLDGGESGLDISCDGHLWAVNRATDRVYEIDSGETGVCAIPWLSWSPPTGSVAAGANQPLALTYNASGVSQPGLYQAILRAMNNTPYPANAVNVKLQVLPPDTWGKLTGIAYSLGRCDVNPAPLKNARIHVQSATGLSWTLKSNAVGNYNLWLDAGASPVTITTSAPGLVTQTLTNISVAAKGTTNQDLRLRSPVPCAWTAPTALNSALKPDHQQTMLLTVTNSGAASMTWNVQEVVPGGPAGSLPMDGMTNQPDGYPDLAEPHTPLANILRDGSFEAGTPNPYWAEYSLTYDTPLCDAASCGTSNGTVGPRTGDWWAWFGGSSVGDMSWITQSLVITTGLTAELNFWLWVSKAATSGGDYLRVYVDATPIYTADVGTQTNSYMPASIPLDVYADGHPHILRFESQTAGYSNFNVDDVAVDVSGNITLICQNDTLPWVSTTPLSGTIAADSYNVLNVQFDATGLTSGTRTGTLCLNTSDAARPQLAIPVMLTIQRQNMTIVKSGPAAAFAGNPITYTIVYTNAGDAEASGVIIVDTLPVNVTAAATTTWNIGTVAPGASGTIVLTATVDSAVISGTVAANTATVFSADDLDLGNNTGSVTTRIVEFYRVYLPLIRR